jgi:hypothetical protein
MKNHSWILFVLFIGIIAAPHCSRQKAGPSLDTAKIKSRLIQEIGEAHRSEIERGVDRVAALWQAEDGSAGEFQKFCLQNFITRPEKKAAALAKIEKNLEIIRGFSHQISRALSAPIVLDLGEITPLDRIFRHSAPSTDYYQSKLAFFVALNFPKYSLEEKLSQGENWTRQEWAMARVGDLFSERIPKAARAAAEIPMQGWEDYFNRYFIHMDRVLTPDQEIIFPEGIRLNCHHGLRDNLKGQFTKPGGLERQRLIYRVMLRIIDQTIPSEMIGGRDFFWEPKSNLLFKKENSQFLEIQGQPEGGSRYGRLLASFHRQRALDPYFHEAQDFITRTFENRQIPETEIEALILSVLASPVIEQAAGLIRQRLGRDLEPSDIWYSGFQAQGKWPEDELDRLTRSRYPNPAAFQADIPVLLQRLGFPEDQARFLGEHVVVDPVRTGGHASGAAMRGDNAHLRTMFGPNGLDYKAFRIGMHEVGHTMHQNLSLYGTDHYILAGLPMSGFAEAIAELFAYRNIKALGLESEPDPNEKFIQALANLWYLYEMGGMALTDMRVWRWMYAHPQTDAAQLQAATLEIAQEIWNAYFEPYFGDKDSPVLGLYSHMISGGLYLHSYFLGNTIMFQIYDFMLDKDFASELDRMCRLGRLTPRLWMQRAVGSIISTAPLLETASEAVSRLSQ